MIGATASVAQRVVMVHEEPRHRLVHDTPDLRVLDVQIQPGDTTLYHTHDSPITYVTIGTSSTDQMALGGAWNNIQPSNKPPGRIGAVRAVQSYAEQPFTHRVTNVGQTLFRLIAIPSRRPGSKTATAPSPTLPGVMVSENRWFRHAILAVVGNQASREYVAHAPTVLVMIHSGRVVVERGDGWITSLEAAGQSTVISEGERYRIRNGIEKNSDIAIVEVR
ncbi:hypothetical protein OAJ07_04695 [Gemmatimonadales bacterium]|nr:hypothetical protein [Gemmatimonadales bacterium]